MKRRQMLRLLGLAPPVFLASCKDDFPKTPTIVTGKVTDELDMPLEGVSIRMYGTKRKGLSGFSTFDIDVLSGKDGSYTLSYVVPAGTDIVKVSAEGTSTITDQTHYIYIHKNGIGSNGKPANSVELRWGDYGKTATINIQYKKQ